jgi:anti-sigma regulatory factor (Ser/Thr protein kinase)
VTDHSASRRFAHDPAEVARARQMVRANLEAWGFQGDLGAMELAVSELVTNAIVHGEGVIDVRVSALGDRLRLEVADEGAAVPRAGDSTQAIEGIGGWGLHLIDSLSDAWGSADGARGTRVWMERSASPASGYAGPETI